MELPEIGGRVGFEHLSFRYPEGVAVVLHDVSFTVEPGQTVALVGHTGAGKSTLVKLLARFYDPTGGRIMIDGHDLRDVTHESLRRQLGIVPQEGFLFSGTVRDNIAFGRPDASLEDVAPRPRRSAPPGSSRSCERLRDRDPGARGRGCRSGSASWLRSPGRSCRIRGC